MTMRFFYAIPVKPSTQLEINKLVRVVTNHQTHLSAVRPENYHITLRFIGEVPSGELSDWIERTDSIMKLETMNPFTLSLDRTGYFKKPGIAWIGPNHVPAQLLSLAYLLHQIHNTDNDDCNINYVPHVTLFRGLNQTVFSSEKLTNPIKMKVHHFGLYCSEQNQTGANYRLINQWDLTSR